MSVEDPSYSDLPEGHPIIKFCDDWMITEWGMREALMELIVGCVIKATTALVEDPDQESELDALNDIPEAS